MGPENKPNQEKKGPHRFKKGQSGNPAGRPKSNLNKLLSEYMGKKSPNGESWETIIVKRVLIDAAQGDHKAREFIWDRLEGKVAQTMDMTSGGKSLETLVIASMNVASAEQEQ